ncbi:MAG: hypothetical protein PVG14_13105 [Anaerolineales bacterium]|jgi:hypothetical protein
MAKEGKQKLTLYRPATYQIKVPGVFDVRWSDWNEGMMISVENDENDQPITTLIGTVDQAALQGILRRLYSLGLPLISVICVDES